MKTDVIINRDALYALRELPSESVNCCVTSPPYYGLRDYGLTRRLDVRTRRSSISGGLWKCSGSCAGYSKTTGHFG